MITREQALDINFLKANCKKIHFFGLGFIQIKLSDYQRVHVYTNKFQSTVTEEDIHNHRYDFNSQILRGTLTQKTYEVDWDRDGQWLHVEESCNPNNKVTPRPQFVDVVSTGVQHFHAGSAYFIPHDVFHRVFSVDAVTLITRSEYKKELAEVVYRVGEELKCPFSVKVSEEKLWEIVEEALK